jgi:ribosomal protein L29
MKRLIIFMAAAALASPAMGAPLPASFAQEGDPVRWYAPQSKYDNAMKEASHALKEALAQCRHQSSLRKSCESEARAQYRRDVAYAKGFRAPTRPIG